MALNLKINLNLDKGWDLIKCKSISIYFKGYLNKFSKKELALSLHDLEKNKEDIKNFIKNMDGHFSIIIIWRGSWLVAVDKIRSIPLIYYSDKKNFYISDTAEYFLNKKKFDIVQDQALHFALTGFTSENNTLYKNIKIIEPSTIIYSNNDYLFDKIEYYKWDPSIGSNNSLDNPKNMLSAINDQVIHKLITSVRGRCIVVPLSAGLDSRFILSGLCEKGYKNIITFSYGRKGNREAKVAESIASYLNLPWIFIPYTNKNQKNIMLSQEYSEFKNFSDTLTSIHFPQDFQAIKYLKENKLIPIDSVIVNGQSGDFISGNHIPDVEGNIENITMQYIAKHYKVWKALLSNNSNYIENIMNKRIKAYGKIDEKNIYAIYERMEFEDRQIKYVINGQRPYEYFGYEWRLPLWDSLYLDFWQSVGIEHKMGQKLYREELISTNWANIWKQFAINPKNSFPYSLKLIRLFFKILFAPVGKSYWYKFELQYLDYFMSSLCGYAPWSYKLISQDKRGFSTGNSWHIEEYLNKKKINWDGSLYK